VRGRARGRRADLDRGRAARLRESIMSIERLTSEGKGQLDANHYLGSKGARSRFTYTDEHGIIVFAAPSSRRIPTTWIELSRWCIERGGQGSRQWAKAIKWLQERAPAATTVVSYSDPSVGHTGALYRACGWLWAPTWHVLRPPPTGSGIRGGKKQAAKHRWVFLLRPDDQRAEILKLRDASLARRFPWVSYTEPRWRDRRPVLGDRPTAYRRWVEAAGAAK
jgi:hypothetical protein